MSALALPADEIDARASRDVRADTRFRWIVGSAGVFVLVSLIAAAMSMFWGGRLAFQTFGLKFLWTDA
ncbi:MAG TPA: phosphate ABC transporter permease subunit PstC, partial [Lysobacter sp.]|nr:phosphate ABC transporter permease subunit PstC [Lysobacter sp.]